jgi:hypothetical protein
MTRSAIGDGPLTVPCEIKVLLDLWLDPCRERAVVRVE